MVFDSHEVTWLPPLPKSRIFLSPQEDRPTVHAPLRPCNLWCAPRLYVASFFTYGWTTFHWLAVPIHRFISWYCQTHSCKFLCGVQSPNVCMCTITVLKANFEIPSICLSESYLFSPSTPEPPNPMLSLHTHTHVQSINLWKRSEECTMRKFLQQMMLGKPK